jgi:hypothetical protein
MWDTHFHVTKSVSRVQWRSALLRENAFLLEVPAQKRGSVAVKD